MNDVLNWISTVGGVVSFLCVIGAIVVRKWVTPYLSSLLAVAKETRSEVQNNGGSSMKDGVDRIERHQQQHDYRMDRVERDVTDVRMLVDHLQTQQDSLIELLRARQVKRKPPTVTELPIQREDADVDDATRAMPSPSRRAHPDAPVPPPRTRGGRG